MSDPGPGWTRRNFVNGLTVGASAGFGREPCPRRSDDIGRGGMPMLYMIIEHFKNRDAVPVYRRFRDQGRQTPEGLKYVSSWVTTDMARCYQLMECEDSRVLEQWMTRWNDLVDFEVQPVITSAQAVEQIGLRL
jgi:hypothetical protein